MLKPIIQPLSGDLDFIFVQNLVDAALKVQETFNCAVASEVGDLVVPSTTVPDTVESIYQNYYPNVVFGIIVKKPTPSTAVVLVSGRLQGAMYGLFDLDFGRALYVGANGRLTTTPPTTGHIQRMGVALKPDSIFLLPSLDKTIRA